MNYRDYLQKWIYKILDPLIEFLVRLGITPNLITTVGLVLNILATCMFVGAGFQNRTDSLIWVGWAGAVILFAGLFDMLDGRLARVGNMCSDFGALYDSVLDRYSELFSLMGIAYYLILQGYWMESILVCFSVIGSMMVSYVRARAEGIGITCKVGLMQRPERVVLTALGAILCGIFSTNSCIDPVWLLLLPQIIIALLANWTALIRIRHCYQKMNVRK